MVVDNSVSFSTDVLSSSSPWDTHLKQKPLSLEYQVSGRWPGSPLTLSGGSTLARVKVILGSSFNSPSASSGVRSVTALTQDWEIWLSTILYCSTVKTRVRRDEPHYDLPYLNPNIKCDNDIIITPCSLSREHVFKFMNTQTMVTHFLPSYSNN